MSDPKVESFKKSVSKPADTWGNELEKMAKQTDDLIKQFIAQRGKIEDAITTAGFKLNDQLKKLRIPADADEKEIEKLPEWFSDVLVKRTKSLEKWAESIAAVVALNGDYLAVVGLDYRWKTIPR